MNIKSRIEAFYKLGGFLKQFISSEKDDILGELSRRHLKKINGFIETENTLNAWFTPESIKSSLKGIIKFLDHDTLENWINKYNIERIKSFKKVGLVMAGNIPLVGFHDLLCIIMAGHRAICKLSGKDSRLFKAIIEILFDINPDFKEKIEIVDGKLSGFDAVIATGSNNTSRYFEYYFGKYPHIIRKNRNAIAILAGNETENELKGLGNDMLSYFGLGCRNVSKLLVPKDYNFNFFFECIEEYKHLLSHNKYMNNHDYNRSIYLVNREPHLDNGFLIVKNDIGITSPISVVYSQEYSFKEEVVNYVNQNRENIQCIVAKNDEFPFETVDFGQAQLPNIDDYADGIDTMEFLTSI